MKKMFFVLGFSSLCMAMNERRELPLVQRQVLIFLLAGVANPNADDIDRALAQERKQQIFQKRQMPDYSNNHHFTQIRNNQQNARIHQPWSKNYALKKNR